MRAIAPHFKLPSGNDSAVSVQERLRQSPSEYFNVYTRSVIPQIEARIEERLLHEYMRTIKNDLERRELHDAYMMRRHRLSRMPEEADMLSESKGSAPRGRRIDAGEIAKTIKTIDGTGIRYHDYGDIGKYTVFPAQYKQRLFPSGAYGRIE